MKTTEVIDKAADHLGLARIDSAPWITDLEARFGCQLPAMYRTLIERYSFGELELGEAGLFSNLGVSEEGDVIVEAFRDPHLAGWLCSRRYFQIGRPVTGSYDPICVQATGRRDSPVVQFDHEDILQGRTKVRERVLANSLLELLESNDVNKS